MTYLEVVMFGIKLIECSTRLDQLSIMNVSVSGHRPSWVLNVWWYQYIEVVINHCIHYLRRSVCYALDSEYSD